MRWLRPRSDEPPPPHDNYGAQVRKIRGGWEWRVVKDGQTVERNTYDGWGPQPCDGSALTRWGASRMARRIIGALERDDSPYVSGRWEAA